MSATTIKRDMPPDVNVAARCECAVCEVQRRAEDEWDVLVNGRIQCPACGAMIHPHFKGKHMAWHLDEGTVTIDRFIEWDRHDLVRAYRAPAASDTPN